MKVNHTKIEKELSRLGLTHIQFARELNMTRQGFEYILKSGKTTFATLERIAKKLDMDEKDLLL